MINLYLFILVVNIASVEVAKPRKLAGPRQVAGAVDVAVIVVGYTQEND